MMNCLKDENLDWYKWLEKRVCVKGTLFGTLKYFGTTKFSDGLWCGVELDEPVGKNNGIVNNIKYFTCLPNFGIFVPESKVCKIESDLKSLDDTFMHLNGTVNLQKCQENTVLVSSSDSQPYNCNEEISEIGVDKTLDIKEDSEESLGLLDPNLIESWDSFTLDTGVDIVKDFQDASLKLDNQGLGFADSNLPTPDILFSDEIKIPKYASTPIHPVKKRFTNFSYATVDHALQNVNEDVYENQMDFGEDPFFDTGKFKRIPSLASTSEVFQIPPDASPNMNILSPVSCSPISDSNNLNKTQIIPIQFLANQDIVRPITMDLNKTQTLQNGCQATVFNFDVLNTTFKLPTKTDTTETKDLNLTVSLKSSEGSKNYQRSNQVDTLADTTSCINMNLNSTFDSDLKFADAAFKKIQTTNGTAYSDCDLNLMETANICLSNTFNNNSSSPQMNGVDKDESMLQKTFVLDSSRSEEKHNIEQAQFVDVLNNVIQFEPFDYKNKFLEETVTLEKTLSDVNARNSVCIPLETHNSSIKSRRFSNSLDLNLTFKTEGKVISNGSITSRNQRKVSSLQLKTNNVSNKTGEFKKPLSIYSSIRKPKAPLKQSISDKENSSLKESVLANSDQPLVSGLIPKNEESSGDIKLEQERENGRFNSIESKSTVSVVKSKAGCYLPLQKKNIASSKILNEINFSASKVPSNSVKNAVPGKKTINKTSNNLTKNPNVINLDKSLVSGIEPKNNMSSSELKLEQEKENGGYYSIENKSELPSKSLVSSCRFSYSSSTASNLPSKDSGNSKISSKINFSSSTKAMPTNDLNVHGTSQVPSNNIKNTLLPKKTINQTSTGIAKIPSLSQFKEQVVKDKLPMPRQSLGLYSNGNGIPRRNSLAVKSKTNLPASRYSMLPLIEDRNFCEAKNTGDMEQLAKSNDHFVPEAVPKVSSHTIANSSKPSRIASQKSQILTRKMGQKCSDVKEEGSASPKIPRYNLRGKK